MIIPGLEGLPLSILVEMRLSCGDKWKPAYINDYARGKARGIAASRSIGALAQPVTDDGLIKTSVLKT